VVGAASFGKDRVVSFVSIRFLELKRVVMDNCLCFLDKELTTKSICVVMISASLDEFNSLEVDDGM